MGELVDENLETNTETEETTFIMVTTQQIIVSLWRNYGFIQENT